MIEAYKIATNLTITGDAHKKMVDFLGIIEKATRHMELFQKMLRSSDVSLNSFTREARLGSTAMRQLDHSIVSAGRDAVLTRTRIDSLRNSVRALHSAQGAGGGRAGGVGMAGMLGGLASRYIAPAAIGYGGYELGKKSFSAYSEYSSALAVTKGMGYGDKVVSDVEKATATGKAGLSPLTQIHAYNAALMATQNPNKASKFYPTLAKAMTVSPTIFGNISKHQLEEATRAAEILAGGDEGKLSSSFSDVLSMMFTSGGTLKPNQIRQMVRKNPSLTRLGLLGLEPVAQELGGEKVSTALQTGRMQFTKGQMGKYQALELHKLGILNAPELDKNGRPIGSKYGNMSPANMRLYNENPTEFLKQVVLPALRREGIVTPEQILNKLSFLFANTTGVLFQNIFKNLPKSNDIIARAKNIPGIQGAAAVQPAEAQATKRFTEAWDTFSVALGKFESPAVITGLNLASKVLEKLAIGLTAMAGNNNTLIKQLSGTVTQQDAFPWMKHQQSAGNVYLNGHKVGRVISKYMSGNAMVDHGSTSILPSYHGVSPSNNNLGGGVSQ